MSRPSGARLRAATVTLAVAATLVLSVAGLWLRSAIGPLWPSTLTDWSLGSALLATSAAAVGAVLAVRIPRNVVGWLFLFQGPLTGLVLTLRQATSLLLADPPAADTALWTAWAFAWLIPINMAMLGLILLLFPFGRPPTRRWRFVTAFIVAAGALACVATMFSPYLPDQTLFAALPNPAAVVPAATGRTLVDFTTMGTLAGLLLAVAAVVVRTRRSRGTERQQMKWFAYAAVVAVTTFIVGFWIEPIFVIATLIAFPGLPVAAGFAVLRYRLYEIDRVINRTVVYGALTAVLAAAYLAAVTAIRAVTEPVTGDTAVAVAASTLAVAALFQPVRRRIQSGVDRRFNRARYDAVATIDALRARLRDDVDLDSLKADLLSAVYATMQPAGTTLWLREAEG